MINVPIFTDNKLTFSYQPGFNPSDSWVYQLLSVTNEKYSSFDEYLEPACLNLVP